MALDFFRIERGLVLDETVTYLQGSGAPGAAGDTAAALVGSVYTDNSTGDLYTKYLPGTGTNKWQIMASQTYVNNAVGATISWREPAFVQNTTSTTLPVPGPGTDTQDGQTINTGDRVLFSALTGGGGKNIYIYNATTGTYTEDTNNETAGDAAYIVAGTSAGQVYIYNGTNWVLSSQADVTELGYIRTFIGKSASGNVTPTYTSTNTAVNGTSLVTAISALDAKLGANVSNGNFILAANSLATNLQSVDTELGPNVTNGNYILAANKMNPNIQALDTHLGANFAAGNYITLNQTVFGAVTALDTAIGANVSNGNFILAANKVQGNITALDNEIGANVTSGGYILSTNTINQNITALNNQLTTNGTQTTVTGVTSITTIDTMPAGTGAAKWLVRVELDSDTTRVYATEVYALSDGTATGSDYTRYATLHLGTSIPGLAVTVDAVGTALRLRVAASSSVTVDAKRVAVVV